MRPRLLSAFVALSGLTGCAQTWGFADRPAAEAAPAPATTLSDPETERLEALATKIESALADVQRTLDEAERSWIDQETPGAVRESLEQQQDPLERRLVLSVALANVRAAIASRREAPTDTPLPEREPIPTELDAVIRQATEQVRAARDRRDALDTSEPPSDTRPPLFSLPTAKEDAPNNRKAAVVEPPPARADLGKALVPHFDTLAACVPDSAGIARVIVRGRLTADGHLRELRVVEGTAIPAITGCLTDRLEAITVPMPEGAAASVVTFPLHFAGP